MFFEAARGGLGSYTEHVHSTVPSLMQAMEKRVGLTVGVLGRRDRGCRGRTVVGALSPGVPVAGPTWRRLVGWDRLWVLRVDEAIGVGVGRGVAVRLARLVARHHRRDACTSGRKGTSGSLVAGPGKH